MNVDLHDSVSGVDRTAAGLIVDEAARAGAIAYEPVFGDPIHHRISADARIVGAVRNGLSRHAELVRLVGEQPPSMVLLWDAEDEPLVDAPAEIMWSTATDASRESRIRDRPQAHQIIAAFLTAAAVPVPAAQWQVSVEVLIRAIDRLAESRDELLRHLDRTVLERDEALARIEQLEASSLQLQRELTRMRTTQDRRVAAQIATVVLAVLGGLAGGLAEGAGSAIVEQVTAVEDKAAQVVVVCASPSAPPSGDR